MKKFVISVFLAVVFCGSAFCSGVDNFGDNPEERELLDRLEHFVLIEYTAFIEDDGTDCRDWAEDEIETFKKKHNVTDNVNKLFEIILKDIEKLNESCASLDYSVPYGYEESTRLATSWSVYKLLEDWKKQQQTALP